MIAKVRIDNKKPKAQNLDKPSVKWHAVSSKPSSLEDDFDTILQRKTPATGELSDVQPLAPPPQTSTTPKPQAKEVQVFDGQDLSGHDFSNQDLTGASFKGCILTGADFSYATLKEANFTGADLTGVTLKEADIENAVLLGIKIDELGLEELQALIEYLAQYYPHKLNLLNINLTLLDLKRIDLSKINLRGVDFTGCDMTGVNILSLDLSSCIISPEQINQALGRPPSGLEIQQMFTPRDGSKPSILKQMLSAFKDNGKEWGVWDLSKSKALENLAKFSKSVYKDLSGANNPKLEDIENNVQKNIEDRVKSNNEEKKKAIEEKKREALAKIKNPQKEDVVEKAIEQPTRQIDISPEFIHLSKGRERG